MNIRFIHGLLSDSFEKQANDQGFTLGDKAELFEKIRYSYNMLLAQGYLTDNQSYIICKKINKSLAKSLIQIN